MSGEETYNWIMLEIKRVANLEMERFDSLPKFWKDYLNSDDGGWLTAEEVYNWLATGLTKEMILGIAERRKTRTIAREQAPASVISTNITNK